jgi:hypothetical protein
MPTPISQQLYNANVEGIGTGQPVDLYSDALAVYLAETNPPDNFLIPLSLLTIRPQRGRFAYDDSPPQQARIVTKYHYGFPSNIGAGPYDRRIDGMTIVTPPREVRISGGAAALAQAASIPQNGTATITDSLTYVGAPDVKVNGALTLRAENQQRPLIRVNQAPGRWSFTGIGECSLVLDGLFVSGADIVLIGSFDSVTLNCCTLDPGSAASSDVASTSIASPPNSPFAIAADGRELVPTRIWIEATVTKLTADRCVLASIRTRNGGLVETVTVTNSILQAVPTARGELLDADDIMDPKRLNDRLEESSEANSLDAVANKLLSLAPGLAVARGVNVSPPISSPPLGSGGSALLAEINQLIMGPSLYDASTFAHVPLSTRSQRLLEDAPANQPAPALNRSLLADAFPLELADAALAFGDGIVNLSRCTVLGRIVVHQLEASECILWELAEVDNTQNGCVRFSAYADGSVLPRKYESVRIQQQASLFTSVDFGQPGYCQLLSLVDASILPDITPSTAPPNTISAGAQDGSEVGAYARDKNPIKQRGLLIKYQEYMPAELVPVVIYAT